MQGIENPDVRVPDTESARLEFREIQISKEVEATYDPIETGGEISGRSLAGPGKTNPNSAKGPWTLVCLVPKWILPENFHIESALVGSGITTFLVPNIVEHKDHSSYELVVAQPCVESLSTRLQGFKLVTDYDLFAPAENDKCIHGTIEAKIRARVKTIANAVEAIRTGWGRGPEDCYRNTVAKAGLKTALERVILYWDIQEADPKVLKRFTQDLLFLGLNWSPNDPILSECYTDDLLQPFQDDHTDFSELLDRAKIPIRMRERAKKQVISIFRRVFVRSGGRIDNRQYDIDLDFSACENASLCAAQLRVSCSRPFGHFDLKEIHSAFSRSTIFVETSSSDIPNAMSGVCA